MLMKGSYLMWAENVEFRCLIPITSMMLSSGLPIEHNNTLARHMLSWLPSSVPVHLAAHIEMKVSWTTIMESSDIIWTLTELSILI